MWAIISKVLLNLIIAVISDKVVVDGAKKMLNKAIDSKVVGIDNEDARDIIGTVAKSTANSLTDAVIKNIII